VTYLVGDMSGLSKLMMEMCFLMLDEFGSLTL